MGLLEYGAIILILLLASGRLLWKQTNRMVLRTRCVRFFTLVTSRSSVPRKAELAGSADPILYKVADDVDPMLPVIGIRLLNRYC